MFHSMNLSEAYLRDHKLRKEAKDQYELTQKNVEKIRTNVSKLSLETSLMNLELR